MAGFSFFSGGTSNRPYRADIDALRALAVSLVIAFHFGAGVFPGGFIGVDIFFVISGFLIGGIVDREAQTGQFSLIRFYERRVRRIFPALFAMLVLAAVVASLVLFPADYIRFGQSAGAAALFWSNIYFWKTAGYWDAAAASKPLLHTWSLAVEEQFYLVFPLILFAIRKWSLRGRLAMLAIMALVSFVASVVAVKLAPTAAFYLAPYRFWEFLIGAGLALFPNLSSRPSASRAEPGPTSPPRQISQWVPDRVAPLASGITSLLGLALIFFSAFTLQKGGNFPGWGAVMPCLGAALVIAAGPQNAVARALSWRPIVFLGLISYSLYLWHWPVWVFASHMLTRAPHGWEMAGCVALTVLLSVLSWKFIEQPFRTKAAVSRKPLFVMAAAATAVVCVFAGMTMSTKGLPGRFDAKVLAFAEAESPRSALKDRCFGIKPKDVSVTRLCGIGAEGQASFVLWGDSHAEAIIAPVADIAKRHNRRGLFAGSPSCAPLVGVDRYDAPECRAFNDHVLRMILAHKEITTVILMARWGKNAQGTAYGSEGHGFVAIGDDAGRAQRPADNAAIFARGLKRTVEALIGDGRRVVLVGPVPEIGFTVPQVLARLAQEHRENMVVAPLAEKFYAREAEVLPLFHALAEQKGVTTVFPHDFLCQSGRCAVRNNGIPLYRDEHHLSDYGAKKLEPLLGEAIDPLFA